MDVEAIDAIAYYQDQDDDGQGVEEVKCIRCEAPSHFATTYGDCNDQEPDIYLGGEGITQCYGPTDWEDAPGVHGGDPVPDDRAGLLPAPAAPKSATDMDRSF